MCDYSELKMNGNLLGRGGGLPSLVRHLFALHVVLMIGGDPHALL